MTSGSCLGLPVWGQQGKNFYLVQKAQETIQAGSIAYISSKSSLTG
jgi:hypothetical protein